jgi:phosphomevalonate kinase
MRAQAPGKVVISGAYAVLDGAPAIVAAVDRYAVADSERAPEFVSDEVREALGDRRAPFIDAGALRANGRKLGLGSSAAILVASLAALELELAPELSGRALAERVLDAALAAHARAQGGGSGIDVAASAFGGVMLARRTRDGLRLEPAALPPEISIGVFAAGQAASTRELVARVRALKGSEPSRYERLIGAQSEASEAAAAALKSGDAPAVVRALALQAAALTELGAAAGVPIVTPELEAMRTEGERRGAAVLPAGAGGGDVALWVGATPGQLAPQAFPGFERLSLALGAPGVSRLG